MKRTIRPEGRHHSMPRHLSCFFGELEAISGVESIDSGRFIPRTKVKRFDVKIQFYDESRRTFRLRVAGSGFISYPEVRVSLDSSDAVENYIQNYSFG
jgi:hypothetical protein